MLLVEVVGIVFECQDGKIVVASLLEGCLEDE